MENLYIVACGPLAAFTATMIFWLDRLRRQIEIKMMIIDFLHGIFRCGLIVLVAAVVCWQLKVWLSVSPLSQLLIGGAVYAGVVVALVWISGTRTWLMESYGDRDRNE